MQGKKDSVSYADWVKIKVAADTQRQTLNAIVFLPGCFKNSFGEI